MERSLRINAPAVVAEIIDGEAVIMDLASGHYFSTQGVGCDVWRGVEAGHSAQHIVESIIDRYDGAPDVVDPTVRSFLADLLLRALIIEVDPAVTSAGRNGTGAPLTGQLPPAAAGSRPAFVPPVLSAYTDMEELLLLDPIHDVDETGWPMPKSPDPES
jgi:hypothetical protein